MHRQTQSIEVGMGDPVARSQPVRGETEPARGGRGCAPAALAVVLVSALGLVCLFAGWVTLGVVLGRHEDRVYPNVYVLDVDIGGLTPAEATALLTETLGQLDAGVLVLRDGERRWPVPWAELGMRLDVEATVQAAFAAGRADQSLPTLLGVLVGRHEVAPVCVLDPQTARATLEQLAPEVSVPPADAAVRLEGDQLIAVPGVPGRVLDVDATLGNLIATSAGLSGNDQCALSFQSAAPRVADAGPALAQAEQMLNRQVHVSAYDVLTDESLSWTLGRDTVVGWLHIEPAVEGAHLNLQADADAIRATLADLAAQLGDGRGFRLEEGAEQVRAAFEAGGGAVDLYLTHPERTYVVQAGDRLTVIADRMGVPPGLIAEANPGVDLNWLQVGQQVVIPSQDVLTPYLPVPGRRVVISIAEQRMRVYEDGVLLYDWPVSTGIATSPTYTGVFQILSKEENAYASQWNLWMPHFLAVYRAGADVYNGIHALPILASGQRLWAGALGSPASYGCIILGIQEGETLYNWADVGTLVIIE
jgi:lipoprotein-anchoring transpeptidase ErfK/SrfK